MDEITRQQLLDCLQQNWGKIVADFQHLPSESQSAYLKKQGYTHLADLLAHVIAWWIEGKRTIENIEADPDFNAPEYDVDAFNARVVAEYRLLEEVATIQSFEYMRQAYVDFVTNLPETAFENPKIVKQLYIEVVEHWQDHQLA